MSRLAGILGAVWEFVVGDDWVTAVGVVVAVALTAAIAGAGAPAWCVIRGAHRATTPAAFRPIFSGA